MSVLTELRVGPRCLVVRLTGVMGPEWVHESEAMFREHLEECSRRGLSGLLYDARDVEMRLGILDRYEAGKSLAAGRSFGIRVGVLGRPEQTTPDRFFEKVARNRGVVVKVATDEQEINEWVGNVIA